MKPRTTLILALVLVVLAAAATLFEVNRRRSFGSAGRPIFPAFSQEKADRIEVRGGGREVELRRDGGEWRVATERNVLAEPRYPREILEGLETFTTSTLISTSPARHATFEVDTSGFVVRVLQGEKALAQFIVGKPGPDFMSTYIRPLDRNEVYLVPSYLRTTVDRGDEPWRKKTILEIPQEDIIGYTARSSKETVTAQKGPEGVWEITEPLQEKARGDVMGMVLRSLATVRATDFADTALTPAEMGLEPDTASVVVRTADGKSYTLTVGATNASNQSYTRLDGDPSVYLVPRGRWNTVFRPSHLLKAATDAEATAPPGVQLPGAPAGTRVR